MELSALGRRSGAADAARAQLLLASLLLALLPICLLHRPIQTHGVRIDLPTIGAETVGAPARTRSFSRAVPPAGPEHPGRYRRLELMPHGSPLLDGEAVGLDELRRRLELIRAEGSDWIDFRPHPEARYETVLETLAVAKRARFGPSDRLRLDNRAFRRALDQ